MKTKIGRARYNRSTASQIISTTAIVIGAIAFLVIFIYILANDRHGTFGNGSSNRTIKKNKRKKRREDKTDAEKKTPVPIPSPQ